jgi:hypothetical protein
LQQSLLLLVLVARHARLVRIVLPPGVDGNSVGVEQHGVVIVIVVHAVAVRIQSHRQKISTGVYAEVTPR